MITQIQRITPLQAGKVSAVMYFIFGALFAIPMTMVSLLAEPKEGAENAHTLGILFFLLMPFLYALMGFIFIPIMCWMYNIIAKWIGGYEITIQDTSDN